MRSLVVRSLHCRPLWFVAGAAILMASVGMNVPGADEQKDPALERTRKQVRMLDDIYKTAVVLITDKYVHSETDFSAGSAASALFDAMRKKGWHDVRLLDASGHPYFEKNLPKSDFDKAAMKALLEGKPYFEEVVSKDGGRELRAATPVPVVSKKCLMCHDNYKDAKEGTPIGFLSYRLKVE